MPWLPGTTGTSCASAVVMAFDLLPMVAMLETGGPTKLTPRLRTSSANWAVLGQEPDPGMERVDVLEFRDADHRGGVQVALVRRIAADADQVVRLGEHVGGNGFHVGVGLDKHHRDAVSLGNAHQLGRRAAAGVDEHLLDRAEQFALAHRLAGRLGLRADIVGTLHDAVDHVLDGLGPAPGCRGRCAAGSSSRSGRNGCLTKPCMAPSTPER